MCFNETSEQMKWKSTAIVYSERLTPSTKLNSYASYIQYLAFSLLSLVCLRRYTGLCTVHTHEHMVHYMLA